MDQKNKERISAHISLVIMFIGILAIALPFVLKADMIQWGFGSAFIGLVITLTAFFVFLMYNRRARVRKSMLSQEKILAHWYYSKEFWDRVCEEDMKDSGMGKVVGFFLGGIFILIGIVIFFVDTDENGLFLLIMLGVAFFFIIIGFISSGAEKRRIKKSLPEVVIAQEGLFYKNILYTWNTKAIGYLESVCLDKDNPYTLLFVLRQLSGGRGNVAHYHQHFIQIPIPVGQEQVADRIIQYFNLPMAQE